jgi:hypothetical protein
MPASPIERRPAIVAALALAVMPMRAGAAPPVEQPPVEQPPVEQPTEQPTEPTPTEQAPPSEPSQPGMEKTPEPEVTEIEQPDAPTGAGIAGAVVDPNDPNAKRAQSDLEGEALDGETEVPERLPPLQTAGWWMTFTAVALATSGGIFAGVAEVREDEAGRLAYGFDLTTGHTTTYGPVADEYEKLLDQGHTYQWVARGLLIAGGVALVTSISLFAVDGVKRRKAARQSARLQLDPGLGGFTLRF